MHAAINSCSGMAFEFLTPEQRVSFVHAWHRLPRHLRDKTFDLHSPEWTPAGIEELGDVLCEFPNVFSSSNMDFGFWLSDTRFTSQVDSRLWFSALTFLLRHRSLAG